MCRGESCIRPFPLEPKENHRNKLVVEVFGSVATKAQVLWQPGRYYRGW